jgi:hypothetical protein
MRVRPLTFSLVAFLMAVGSQGIGLAQSTQQGAQPRYSITISSANTRVKAGSELRVQIVQKNITDQDQLFWVWKNYKSKGE